ncbi:hypothetical protein [Streptomyces hokutonensis]|uniref:hypothetical protein n=1 Tax=Streptomyces hokutonensis TaxID=1306990 RepID=UPI0033C03C9E
MALDLSGVRRIVEKPLDNEFQLWREAEGVSGDELDEATGQLKQSGATPVILREGMGVIVLGTTYRRAASRRRCRSAAGVHCVSGAAAAHRAVDGRRRCAERARSVRDPQFVCRRFRATDIGVGTYAVARILRLESADQRQDEGDFAVVGIRSLACGKGRRPAPAVGGGRHGWVMRQVVSVDPVRKSQPISFAATLHYKDGTT